jgi:peptidoglycan/LPS O-acetylase OafA/YrhL
VSDTPRVSENVWSLLAGLRFFLATVVVFYDCQQHLPPTWSFGAVWFASYGGLQAAFAFLFISGFSIAHSYETKPGQFFSRRFYRLAPVYIAGFILSVLPFALIGPVINLPHGTGIEAPDGLRGRIGFLLNFFCLQGWYAPPVATFVQSWTMTCVVFYYLLTPLVTKLSDKWILRIAGLSFALYIWSAYTGGTYNWEAICDLAPFALAFFWLTGVYFYRNFENQKLRLWLPFALAVGGVTDWNNPSPLGGVTMLGAGLVATKGESIKLNDRARKWLNIAGRISYPLYLTHLIVIILAAVYIRHLPVIGSYLVYAACVAVATVIYVVIDLPMTIYAKKQMTRVKG